MRDSLGITFVMKDGKKDSYDPVVRSEFQKNQTETHYIIDNGFYVYEVAKADVESVNYYCPCCGKPIDPDDIYAWR